MDNTATRQASGTPAPTQALRNTRAARLSLLWVFAVLNYLYCDILGLMDPDSLKGYLEGNVGGLQITQGFLLSAGILMEIPIAMVLLSVVLPYAASRWANITAGTIMTIVQVGSLFVGSGPTAFYLFFSIIEIACTAFIVWYAWTWRRLDEPRPVEAGHPA